MGKTVQEILAQGRKLAGKPEQKTRSSAKTSIQVPDSIYSSPVRKGLYAHFLSDEQPLIKFTDHVFYEFNLCHDITGMYVPYRDGMAEWVVIHGHPFNVGCYAGYFCFESRYRPKATDSPEFIKQFYLKWKGLKK